MKANLQIKQLKSVIGQTSQTRERMRGLGLRGVGSTVTVANTPSFRGAVKKVMHLITVVEV
jgi:large subunit ribosomal protein L30